MQSLEYRYVRTPVNSLPQLQRDTKLESADSYSQMDWNINRKQSATISLAIDPQKLDYLGVNTFTPQEYLAHIPRALFLLTRVTSLSASRNLN